MHANWIDLVRNMLARGVLTPILCRTVNGRHEVINGRQRVKGSREVLKLALAAELSSSR